MVTWIDILLASILARRLGDAGIGIELWDGSRIEDAASSSRLVFRSRPALLAVLTRPALQFGEQYTCGGIDMEGDLADALAAVFASMPPRHESRLSRAIRRRSVSIDAMRAYRNVHHHYDLGLEFYRLWLDEQMVYTCGYFATPEVTLEQAQLAKMDHVCRKLRLQPGETVIEAGCGWGALAMHMAEHYGARVRAYNISTQQVEFARARAAERGLGNRVEFVAADYREITGSCDAFVCIGMLEHVGPRHYRELGGVIRQVTSPRGRGLLHSIGRISPQPTDPWLRRRIFPDGYAPSLAEMSRVFEPSGLTIVDIENLRPHYERTLQHWLARFEEAAPRIRETFDERFVRTWRLYLASCIGAFRVGTMQLFQILFTCSPASSLPWTRADLYR